MRKAAVVVFEAERRQILLARGDTREYCIINYLIRKRKSWREWGKMSFIQISGEKLIFFFLFTFLNRALSLFARVTTAVEGFVFNNSGYIFNVFFGGRQIYKAFSRWCQWTTSVVSRWNFIQEFLPFDYFYKFFDLSRKFVAIATKSKFKSRPGSFNYHVKM